jgi:hypothetical protein
MSGPWKTNRPISDLLVLMITFTVCFSVVISGMTIAVIAFFHPDTDVSLWTSKVSGIINTMVGLLAGFLAGRTTAKNGNTKTDESDAGEDGPSR